MVGARKLSRIGRAAGYGNAGHVYAVEAGASLAEWLRRQTQARG